MLEKLDNREAGIENLDACQAVLGRTHELGILHGDVNGHNLMVSAAGVKMVIFESTRIEVVDATPKEEMQLLPAQLNRTSGRGGWWRTSGLVNSRKAPSNVMTMPLSYSLDLLTVYKSLSRMSRLFSSS